MSESESVELLCPSCGYDLRAAAADRCSECGLEIDVASLSQSAIPWEHRRQIGRVRAFVKTIWQVTMDSRALRYELARMKGPRDASRFRWWMASVLSITFLAVFAAITHMEGGNLSYLAVQQPSFGWGGFNLLPGPVQDLAVPWSAGATLWPTLPVCLVFLAIYISAAQRPIFRLRAHTDRYRAQAQASSLYLSAPLAWLLVGEALIAGGLAWTESDIDWYGIGPIATLHTFSGLFFAASSPLIMLWRTAQWTARANHSGYATGLLGGAELLTRWLVGILIFLGFFPWVIGFHWIVIDSFG